jgi:hypothetical protein
LRERALFAAPEAGEHIDHGDTATTRFTQRPSILLARHLTARTEATEPRAGDGRLSIE